MTRLLVSVRDAEEARLAWQSGATVIDVKEPGRGSLGAADAVTWQAVRDSLVAVPGVNSEVAILSAAVGELVDWNPRDANVPPHGYRFAKLGLARCQGLESWPGRWADWAQALLPGTQPVAVAYADYAVAQAPHPREVLVATAERGARMLLLDTCDKSNGTLFDCLSDAALAEFMREARGAGLGIVLAGSLQGESFVRALEFGPEFVAVRGAACVAGRNGPLDAARVAALREQLAVAAH